MILLSFLAGLITVFSPCVLPVIPIIFGAALQRHRLAPLVLVLSMMMSFVVVGFLTARVGHAFISPAVLRGITISVLIVFGLFMVVRPLEEMLIRLLSPVMARFQTIGDTASRKGSLWGMAVLGAVLGFVWSPCVGPILGVVIGIASQQEQALYALGLFVVYALGAGLPMLMMAYLSHYFVTRKSVIQRVGRFAKPVFGWLILIIGVMMLTGWDKQLESLIVGLLPEEWILFLTRY